jgi:two-component system OmpR family sensor kinase
VSLRARVLIVLLVVSAAVAITVDTVTYVSLRSFLLKRVDQQLTAAHNPFWREGRGGRVDLQDVSALAPGVYVEARNVEGQVVQKIPLRQPDQEAVEPTLPATLPLPEVTSAGRNEDPRTTVTVSSAGVRYRVSTWKIPGGYLTLALPLSEFDSTLQRLLLIELAVTALALAAGLGLARSLVQVGLKPLDDIGRTAGAIAAGDLTQRVGLEDDRTEIGRLGRALNTMLGQIELAFAERKASEDRLRRFVADASHELRTPLTSIRAYAELFERGANRRPKDLGRLLEGIETEAVRMGVLVDDLLLLARLDQGRPLEQSTVDLGAVAGDAVDAARAIDDTRPLRLEVTGSVEVQGDRLRLRQVLDNLLANVRAHTPAGTAATVAVRAEGAKAQVSVSDDGPGLSPEQQAKVFERFYRADPSRARDAGGSGLGLAIVAAIADAHGGRAGVKPSAVGGAEFLLELPLYGEPVPGPPLVPLSSPPVEPASPVNS